MHDEMRLLAPLPAPAPCQVEIHRKTGNISTANAVTIYISNISCNNFRRNMTPPYREQQQA